MLEARAELDVAEGEEETVTLRPVERGDLEGVLVGADGAPLAGVTLEAQPIVVLGLYLRAERAETDGSGRFRFAGLPLGEVRIEDYVEGRELAVAVVPSMGVRVTLPREKAGSVVLAGIDAGGDLDGVGVEWIGEDGESSGTASVGYFDDRWMAMGLPAGSLLLRIAAIPGGVAEVRVELAAGECRILDGVELRPWRRVRGRVIDGAGEPVAGASILVEDAVEIGESEILTDAGGSFEALVDGSRPPLLWVGADGFGSRDWQFPAAGEEAGDFVLRRVGFLDVRLRGSDGRPLMRWLEFLPAEAADPEGDAWWGRTDERGRDRMELPPGRWKVRVQEPGDEGRMVDLAEVDLPEGGDLPLDLVHSQ